MTFVLDVNDQGGVHVQGAVDDHVNGNVDDHVNVRVVEQWMDNL